MSTLSIVISGFKSIDRHGWCNIWKGHTEAIEIIKNTLDQCGSEYTIREDDVSIQLNVKVDKT